MLNERNVKSEMVTKGVASTTYEGLHILVGLTSVRQAEWTNIIYHLLLCPVPISTLTAALVPDGAHCSRKRGHGYRVRAVL